jgi:hypothetical protein
MSEQMDTQRAKEHVLSQQRHPSKHVEAARLYTGDMDGQAGGHVYGHERAWKRTHMCDVLCAVNVSV